MSVNGCEWLKSLRPPPWRTHLEKCFFCTEHYLFLQRDSNIVAVYAYRAQWLVCQGNVLGMIQDYETEKNEVKRKQSVWCLMVDGFRGGSWFMMDDGWWWMERRRLKILYRINNNTPCNTSIRTVQEVWYRYTTGIYIFLSKLAIVLRLIMLR